MVTQWPSSPPEWPQWSHHDWLSGSGRQLRWPGPRGSQERHNQEEVCRWATDTSTVCVSLPQSRSERHSWCCVEPSLANIDNSVARLVSGPGLARPADHNSQCNSLHTALLATLSVGRDSSRCLLVTRLQTQILVCCKLWQQRALCLLCSWPRLQPRLTLQPPVSLSLSLSAVTRSSHSGPGSADLKSLLQSSLHCSVTWAESELSVCHHHYGDMERYHYPCPHPRGHQRHYPPAQC